jgi:hypothetical protein
VEVAHEADGRDVPQPRERGAQGVHRRAGGARGVLRVERQHEDAVAALRAQLRDARGDGGIAVPARPRDREGGLDALAEVAAQQLHLAVEMHAQGRALLRPHRGVLGRALRRAGKEDDPAQDRPPGEARDLDHARVPEELGKVAAHGGGRGRVGRAQVHQQHAGARRRAVRVGRLGQVGHQCCDSAEEMSFAVTSTMGITRS